MYGRSSLSGGLNFICLAEIFQILTNNKSTGSLHLMSPYASGRIYFVNGKPVNAVNGTATGLDAVYNLFGWVEGNFEFHEEMVSVEHKIHQNSMQITLEALRMLDEGKIKKITLPGMESIEVAKRNGTSLIKGETLPVIRGPLIDYMYIIDEEKFHDGRRIVTEGSYGNWIWVILEGIVQVIKETPSGPVTVARLGDGCFIGTLVSLLHGANRRSATVVASGDVHLGLLDTQRLAGEFTCLSSDFRRLLYSLAGRLNKITDKTVELSMDKHVKDETNLQGQLFMDKGTDSCEVFTIAEGETYVIGETSKGKIPLLTLSQQDVFGNVPFMNIGHEPHRAFVLGSKDLKVTSMDIDHINREYDRLSDTFRSLIYDVSNCISQTTSVVTLL